MSICSSTTPYPTYPNPPAPSNLDNWLKTKTSNTAAHVHNYANSLIYQRVLGARRQWASRFDAKLKQKNLQAYGPSWDLVPKREEEASESGGIDLFDKLPNELLYLIVELGTRADAREVRLVSRKMEEIARPWAFGLLWVCQQDRFDDLLCLAQSPHISSLVKTLHVELPDPNGSDPLLSYNLELLPPSVLLLSQLCTFSFTDIGESFPFDRSLFIALVSHPTLTSLEHDGFFHSRDTLPFDSFRRVRMQPIKLRNLRLPASLASTIETTRLLQSLISTPLLFNIHSLDLSFFDQGQNPNDRSYLSTLLSPNLQIPHLDSITLSFDQTSFFPSELYASTWLASFLARFPTLETLNLVCVDRFDHSADLIYPVIRFAESAGFNGFGEDGQVWWDDWSQFGVKHLSLGFSKSSETGQGRRLLVFKIEVEKGGPNWNGEALEHEPVEMDEDFLELLARAFPYLECIEIGGVFISTQLRNPPRSTPLSLFPPSRFSNLHELRLQIPLSWIADQPPVGGKTRVCTRTYAVLIRHNTTGDRFPSFSPQRVQEQHAVDERLERIETDLLLHPHRTSSEVLVGLGDRTGWADLARAIGTMEKVELRLAYLDEEGGTTGESIKVCWRVERWTRRDGAQRVKLVEEESDWEFWPGADDALCNCNVYPNVEDALGMPRVALFDAEDGPGFHPAFTLDSYVISPASKLSP